MRLGLCFLFVFFAGVVFAGGVDDGVLIWSDSNTSAVSSDVFSVSEDMAFAGKESLNFLTESNDNTVAEIDLASAAVIGKNRFLQMRVNFDPKAKCPAAKIGWIEILTSQSMTVAYTPNTAVYYIDELPASILDERLSFDADPGTWQLLTLDLGSVDQLDFSEVDISRISIVFQDAVNVYIDDVRLVADAPGRMLFDEEASIGTVDCDGKISAREASAGEMSLTGSFRGGAEKVIGISFDPAIQVGAFRRLKMKINFIPKGEYQDAAVYGIRVRNGEGVADYNLRDTQRSRFYIDGQACAETNQIPFDRDPETWQELALDLDSGPGLSGPRISDVEVVFENSVRVYIDEVMLLENPDRNPAALCAPDPTGTLDLMPVESVDSPGDWEWMTENRYRVVLQCQPPVPGVAHQLAWAELDFDGAYDAGLIDSSQWNPDSIRVVEYDAKTKKPVKYDDTKPGNEAWFAPAKIDEWRRRHIKHYIFRKPHLSWIRRNGNASNAVYICYFDVQGRGEQQKLLMPAFVGSGDALSFGAPAVLDTVRGVPLVFDWDDDGDLDLLGGLGSVPERAIYLYENKGNALVDGFAKPVSMKGKEMLTFCSQVMDVNGDGKLDAVSGSSYYSDFRANGFVEKTPIGVPLDSEAGELIRNSRIKSFAVADWDGDGVNDLIANACYWKEYGFSDAYNSDGVWTNGPLRGWFFFFKNQGSNQSFDLAAPVQLMTIEQEPADMFGNLNVVVNDIDRDGDLDILSGDFISKIMVFKNIGTATEPQLDIGRALQTTNGVYESTFQANMISLADFNGDGYDDLFTRTENDWTGYLENTGTTDTNGLPVFKPVQYLKSRNDYLTRGQLPVLDICDFNQDGKWDLLVGDSPGMLGYFAGDALYPNLRFHPYQPLASESGPLRIVAGKNGSIQGPAEALWGYTVPASADWDGDGRNDVLMNSIWGRIEWARNLGNGLYSELEPVKVQWDGAAPKPEWRWWNPEPDEWSTQWRCMVQPIDWDEDGLLDAVTMDYEGYMVLHRRRKVDGRLVLGPGERIFRDYKGDPWQITTNRGGGSGRRKFEFADWDNDGDRDLVVDRKEIGGNVVLYENVTNDEAPQMVMVDNLADIVVQGHTCSPALVDLDSDGKLDLVMAAEDGHFYVFHRSYIENKQQLQARFLTEDGPVRTEEEIVLFDDKLAIGKLGGGTVSGEMVRSGRLAIKKVSEGADYFNIMLDLRGCWDVENSRYMKFFINFVPDVEHANRRLKYVRVYEYNGYRKDNDVVVYDSMSRDCPAQFYIDGRVVWPGDPVELDADPETWQSVIVDLHGGARTHGINTRAPSGIYRRVDIIFKNASRVYLDDISFFSDSPDIFEQ
ncbi:FG-GAP repeat domain-containing protein [Tichowtungia aerotolerans]|uniref:FG-GAP repeat protein n=1 Tax=Tichowtungia aerotolerans TaxID=2697043 RepID=A0A6P1M2W5_9BACT|nr:VCBS repeat-containing protein [Tichowtungia aerotolerans]QHI69179.1 hypothetical protein GT409_06845 [Tichowtungia aerotolerans]